MTQQRLIPELQLQEPRSDELSQLMEALMQLSGPGLSERRVGLRRLIEGSYHRRSPLAAAMLVRGIGERDLELRREFVVALAEVIAGAGESPERVSSWLRHNLGQIRRREVYSLLQVAASSPGHTGLVHLVLDQCSFSGATLLQILLDRKADITIRVVAAHAIAELGFLDAAPEVSALQHRLARRFADQEELGLTTSLESEAELLLPALESLTQSLDEASVQ